MRVLMNTAVRRALAPPAERSPVPSTIGETTVFGRQYAIPLSSTILPTIHTHRDFDEICLSASAGLSFVNKIEPAAEIVRDIIDARRCGRDFPERAGQPADTQHARRKHTGTPGNHELFGQRRAPLMIRDLGLGNGLDRLAKIRWGSMFL
jgi:hypothetical protein